MTFNIPTNKVEKLEKIIKRYQKKGANIQFDILEDVVEKGTLFINDPRTCKQTTKPISVKCKKVFVNGQYKINGWCFVGTIQFADNGNIIRLADICFEGLIPEKYRHTKNVCEHCGTIRNRKDTYLIYNQETNEYKQVGKNCLMEYTNGLNADECAEIMSCLDQVETLGELNMYEDDFFAYRGCGCACEETKNILPYAYGLVKSKGCVKGQELSDFYFHNLPQNIWEEQFGDIKLASDDEIKEIMQYANENIESNNDYLRNCALVWTNRYCEYRDFGLMVSFVNTFLKENARQKSLKADKNNSYVGKVGDRITIKVKSARVLYICDNSMYSYYANDSYAMEIIDTEGHTYFWKASTNNFGEGDTITATIKGYKDYKGLKQTILTRGKVVRQ